MPTNLDAQIFRGHVTLAISAFWKKIKGPCPDCP